MLAVATGDIAGYAGDAVVNAANNHLQLGAGVAGAIRRAGGEAIQAECDRHLSEHGPIRVGEAVVTGAGRMRARWVIHAAAMGDEPASDRSIRAATVAALDQATRVGARSVAFPVLGAGVGGFAFERSASLMVDVLRGAVSRFDELVIYGYSESDAARLRELVEVV